MDCIGFRNCWIGNDPNGQESDAQAAALAHMQDCPACADAALAAALAAQERRVGDHPCLHMAQYARLHGKQHADACPDALVHYNEVFDEYTIRHGDGEMHLVINFCPWCGTILPESQREAWFEQLQAMGFDHPDEQEIPAAFRSGAWWQQERDGNP